MKRWWFVGLLMACGGAQDAHTPAPALPPPHTTLDGLYDLDTKATAAASHDATAAAMFKELKMTLELKPDGGAVEHFTATDLSTGKPTSYDKTGTWQKDGEAVVAKIDPDDLRCARSGDVLTCSDHRTGATLILQTRPPR